MFYDCESLESLDVSRFDTSHVIDMSYMFSGLENLKSLNLSNFDTSELTNIKGMFSSWKRNVFLDLTGFNLEKFDDQIFTGIFSDTYIKFLNIKDIRSKDGFLNRINMIKNKSSMFLCLNDVSLIPKIDSDITICCNFDVETETCDSSNYISLYYSNTASYSSGFANNNRNYISFLKYNNQIKKKLSPITVDPNEKLEVKFAFPLENIDNFF
jgi:surface protein